MEEELKELESILKRELELNYALCETAELFNKAIKCNDIAFMQKATLEQDEKICNIEQLEESRLNCCSTLSRALNPAVKELKFSSLNELISPEWKKRLSSLHGSLKSTITRLSKINTSNRILLEEANAVINKTFDILRHSQDHLHPYSSQGKVPARHSGCALYNNIA